jgi:hypothetical protein
MDGFPLLATRRGSWSRTTEDFDAKFRAPMRNCSDVVRRMKKQALFGGQSGFEFQTNSSSNIDRNDFHHIDYLRFIWTFQGLWIDFKVSPSGVEGVRSNSKTEWIEWIEGFKGFKGFEGKRGFVSCEIVALKTCQVGLSKLKKWHCALAAFCWHFLRFRLRPACPLSQLEGGCAREDGLKPLLPPRRGNYGVPEFPELVVDGRFAEPEDALQCLAAICPIAILEQAATEADDPDGAVSGFRAGVLVHDVEGFLEVSPFASAISGAGAADLSQGDGHLFGGWRKGDKFGAAQIELALAHARQEMK